MKAGLIGRGWASPTEPSWHPSNRTVIQMIPTLTSIDQREFELARDEPSRSPSRRSHSHAGTFLLSLLSLSSAQTGTRESVRLCVCVPLCVLVLGGLGRVV